jgi:hypothetical protein
VLDADQGPSRSPFASASSRRTGRGQRAARPIAHRGSRSALRVRMTGRAGCYPRAPSTYVVRRGGPPPFTAAATPPYCSCHLCKRLAEFAEAPACSGMQQRVISRASRRATARIRPTQQRAGAPSGAPRLLLCQEAGVLRCAPGPCPRRASALLRRRRPDMPREREHGRRASGSSSATGRYTAGLSAFSRAAHLGLTRGRAPRGRTSRTLRIFTTRRCLRGAAPFTPWAGVDWKTPPIDSSVYAGSSRDGATSEAFSQVVQGCVRWGPAAEGVGALPPERRQGVSRSRDRRLTPWWRTRRCGS